MHQPIERRMFLKAAGVGLALPLLESMQPALFAATQLAPPKRMVYVCTTLGLHPQSLWPATTGSDYESTEYLNLLKAHRDDFTLFAGLSHKDQAGRQPHNCEMTWLTSARGPGLGGFRNSISVDQYAASQLGYTTRFPSIALGSNSRQSQSFNSSGVMVPAETSPSRLFSQLFLQGNKQQLKLQKQKLKDGRSILDQLQGETRRLRKRSSVFDNQQLDQYFQALRDAEKDITAAEGWTTKPKPIVDADTPRDITDGADLIGRTRLLLNLVPLILQTDSSRVVSVMVQDHQVVPKVDGVAGEHHNLSHHGQDESKIAQLRKIESELVNCFGDLLGQLKSINESGTSLLNQTSVLFGSNLGNANSHATTNLPIFLAGGNFQHGQYVDLRKSEDQPLCNLFLTLLQQAGIEAERFGQSTGTLTW